MGEMELYREKSEALERETESLYREVQNGKGKVAELTMAYQDLDREKCRL